MQPSGRTDMHHPFPKPSHPAPDLARVEAYWHGLLRGSAQMPFWDDCRLTDLPDLAGRLFLIDAFADPQRFRFATVGADLGGRELEGGFLDEAELPRHFAFLPAQCSATLEARRPTGWRMDADEGGPAYTRLLLPMWGDGRISMLLGVVG
jgi:hypothetical protein